MIAFVNGIVSAVEDDSLIVDIGGVGLSVLVPIHMLDPRPVVGNVLYLHTHLQIREDAWVLYGFSNKEQLKMFRLLLNVSGVGAKTALAIVDTIGTNRFYSLVANQEIKPITAVSGVGKKTAERILLELKDKFPAMQLAENADMESGAVVEVDALDRDLLAALKQLGYSATEARAFAMQAQGKLGMAADTERLLREALKIAMHS